MLTPSRKSQILSVLPNYRALYLFQHVGIVYWNGTEEPDKYKILPENIYADGYLSIRSVSDLTEEEAKQVMSMQQVGITYSEHTYEATDGALSFRYKYKGEWHRYDLDWEAMFWDTCDYLRSCSIALPYYSITTGLITVDEWVEVGVVQIRK